MNPTLSETRPPLEVVAQWLEQADRSGLWRNPGAMCIATVGADGHPAARMVLLKRLDVAEGYAVFYTHYRSRKGREIEQSGWAAATLYWEAHGRQVRLEGPVLRSPAEESDAYFASRPLESQLNAWASAQSEPLEDLGELERRAAQKAQELGVAAAVPSGRVPRPPGWGGYRLWCAAVELWVEGRGRFHERVRFERSLDPAPAGFRGDEWRAVRLQP
ncbi:MAG TPA: pyridoxamine 5'-phosphate oxidase [Gammaproteobacteria bacterium]|nr:pyridoxamine 5'-phosphate oxidase [Gammaproteobacteria bacterium]